MRLVLEVYGICIGFRWSCMTSWCHWKLCWLNSNLAVCCHRSKVQASITSMCCMCTETGKKKWTDSHSRTLILFTRWGLVMTQIWVNIGSGNGLLAPSLNLNWCLLIITETHWNLAEDNSTETALNITHYIVFKNYTFGNTAALEGAIELNQIDGLMANWKSLWLCCLPLCTCSYDIVAMWEEFLFCMAQYFVTLGQDYRQQSFSYLIHDPRNKLILFDKSGASIFW